MQTADAKYKEAIELYKTTDLTITEISRRCNVSRGGLARHIQKHHRDLMMHRHGVEDQSDKKLRKSSGQNVVTREKYREAVEACDSSEYLHLNISQIAEMFGLSGPALANQLRAHYPDVMPRREAARRNAGLADNTHRGVRLQASEIYAKAVEMLRNTDLTIKQVADRYGVSYTGLRQHLLFYHKDLVEARKHRREEGKKAGKVGALGGNGKIRVPEKKTEEKYAEALKLVRTSKLPIAEIARRTNVGVSGLRHYLRTWHPDFR